MSRLWKIWRRTVGLDQSRWPRQLTVSREGKLLILITIGLGFAAINTGNNLLYLILGMLLSLIVLSGILSELSLQGIVVKRHYCDAVHAQTAGFMAIEITNTKKRLSSFCVEIEESFDDALPVEQRPAYALNLHPGQSKTIALRLNFERRGLWKSTGLKIATRFPFSFFRKSRVVASPTEFLVFPAIREVSPPNLTMEADFGAEESRQVVGIGSEYHALREYSEGDDPRSIHWKSTARLGTLICREYEAMGDRKLWLLVANRGLAEDELDGLESAISETASLALHYSSRGWSVGLCSMDGCTTPIAGQLTLLMTHLAMLTVHAEPKAFAVIPQGGSNSALRLLVRHAEQRPRLGFQAWDRVHEVDHAI
ncbi:MAG TPA: DUF58 domain-containing protein [Myxococcales bacterium]|nr:DUF58 domain-containing protein [Myxococcales bacterium]HIN84838.1 DUF58 domain-containing protein [Myxococcales bacterium]